MTTENEKKPKPKPGILQKKFVAPTTASALALLNDAAQMGLEHKTVVLAVVAALAYAAIEAAVDIARILRQPKAG